MKRFDGIWRDASHPLRFDVGPRSFLSGVILGQKDVVEPFTPNLIIQDLTPVNCDPGEL